MTPHKKLQAGNMQQKLVIIYKLYWIREKFQLLKEGVDCT